MEALSALGNTVLNILMSLGVDKTFFIFFIMFGVTFFALKKILFERLVEVLETRELATNKALEQSKDVIGAANADEEKYQQEVARINKELGEKVAQQKHAIAVEIKTHLDQDLKVIDEQEKVKLDEVQKELHVFEGQLMASKDELKKQLLNKILS